MRAIVAGGGTGGHIYPALAIARELRDKSQAHVLYVGTRKGLESGIVPPTGIPFATIAVSGWNRRYGPELVRVGWNFLRAVWQSWRMMRSFRPDVVIGTGAYVSLPVLFTAWMLRIPTVIHEIEVLPGLANRLLARIANVITLANEKAATHFPRAAHKLVVTGNPRATEAVRLAVSSAKARVLDELGLSADKRLVVIVSGSRGSATVNKAVVDSLPELSASYLQVVFVTGAVHYEAIAGQVETMRLPNRAAVKIVPFVADFAPLMGAATLMVARAGASTVAEATALGVPTIYIPSPYVTNNHQELNAHWLEQAGAVVMIREADLTPAALTAQIVGLAADSRRLQDMRDSSLRLGKPDALERICEAIHRIPYIPSHKK